MGQGNGEGISYGESRGWGQEAGRKKGNQSGDLWDKPETCNRGGSWEDMGVTLAETSISLLKDFKVING